MIDKSHIYIHNNYQYKNFILLTDEEKAMVWSWRNDENVRKWMYNSDLITLENHLNFIISLQQRTDCFYWIVYKNSQPYGVVNITSVDEEKGFGEVGLYRNPSLQDNGGGLDFYYNYYDFLFFSIGFEILKAGMSPHNDIAILLNSFLGFKCTGIIAANEVKYFYEALCIKKNIEKEWANKNNLREMLKYLKSPYFTEWKDVLYQPNQQI
jgi:UDP-4-amino-4,6-dideoxy-N-acetyl-beta-L-altrosamine N-acetyltransferase